jgi:hypothetical protein
MKRIQYVVVLLLFTLSSVDLYAQRDNWVRLGSRKVNYTLDRDEIPVTYRGGAFESIRVVVTGGSMNMHKCVVHFENGSVQEIDLRHTFTRASSSRVIDLRGNKRFIEKIVFWYDTKNLSRGRATVTVFGKK